MPIPFLNDESAVQERRRSMRLVPEPKPEGHGTLLYPRALAHFVDSCVVLGLSLYCAKLWTVVLVSLHASAISRTGKAAGSLLLDAYSYSSAELFAASVSAIAILYFVALPLVAGRTLGLGLLGLRVRAPQGAEPSMQQHLLRLFGCALTYGTAGLLFVVCLRHRDGRFATDVLSGTTVTRE